jgi:mRNA interferase RelE/StbE
MTLEILGDTEAVARISESLAALGRGEPGADLATVRQDLARRRATGNVRTEPEQRYQIQFQPAARRAIAERLPETVAAAVLEFCEAVLAVNPHRVGTPLSGPLTGCHGPHRGTYRIVYRIDETNRAVHVFDIVHRAEICHRPHS